MIINLPATGRPSSTEPTNPGEVDGWGGRGGSALPTTSASRGYFLFITSAGCFPIGFLEIRGAPRRPVGESGAYANGRSETAKK